MTGAPNKNIGEAFLFAWRFPQQFVQQDKQGQLFLKESKVVRQIADLSVIAFVKIVANINLSNKLKEYGKNQALLERIPKYRVKMGFGLHCNIISNFN